MFSFLSEKTLQICEMLGLSVFFSKLNKRLKTDIEQIWSQRRQGPIRCCHQDLNRSASSCHKRRSSCHIASFDVAMILIYLDEWKKHCLILGFGALEGGSPKCIDFWTSSTILIHGIIVFEINGFGKTCFFWNNRVFSVKPKKRRFRRL